MFIFPEICDEVKQNRESGFAADSEIPRIANAPV
jgi:hypothetical protein